MTDLVATWTGWHANALRQALRMTNEEFAEHLDVSVRTVVYWRTRPEMMPRQSMQQLLDVALQRAPDLAQAQFRRLLVERDGIEPRGAVIASASADPASLTEWLTATSTSDEEIGRIDRAVAALAQAHPLTPAATLLTDARQLQAKVQRVLAGGRLRHRQERELLRVNGDVLAHMSLLLSDLDATRAADDYGNAALLYLREAAASEATAWYVLAKNARWSHRYLLAADLANHGLRHGSSGPMTVQLACYEANASALAGDASRARAAMRHAEDQARLLPGAQATPSPWSFPPERMTIFRLSVTLHTGDPDGALLAASDVSPSWSDGAHVPAAWAQIRIGAGIACLLKDEPDGAVEQVRPVLDLPSGLRIATVTGWLADLDRHLADGRYAHVPVATELRQEIREFTATALDAQKAAPQGGCAVNGLPARMIDRWQDRAEPAPGEGLIYWHMLVGTDPEVIALVREARPKLVPFTGLHLTPYAWLHITALIAGPASEISGEEARQLASVAGWLLADIPPAHVTIGEILYHPEAIMLAVRPTEALLPVLEAVREATRQVTGSPGRTGSKPPWTPHITIAYSTTPQPAEPIINALGRTLPERKIQISQVSLVNQRGPERNWDWHLEATIRFGITP